MFVYMLHNKTMDARKINKKLTVSDNTLNTFCICSSLGLPSGVGVTAGDTVGVP